MAEEQLSRFEHALKDMRTHGTKWRRRDWAESAFVHVADGDLVRVFDTFRNPWTLSGTDLLTADWVPYTDASAAPLYSFHASDFFTFDHTATARQWVASATKDRLQWLQQHIEKFMRGGAKSEDIEIQEHPGNRTVLVVGGHRRAEWTTEFAASERLRNMLEAPGMM